MKPMPASKPETLINDDDSSLPLQHTGEQPFRRPPEDEPERVGEGELDIGAPENDRTLHERAWEGEEDEDAVGPDEEND